MAARRHRGIVVLAISLATISGTTGIADAVTVGVRGVFDGSRYFRSIPNGTSVKRTFNRRGTFRFYCTIHGNLVNGACSGMCGSIVVS